MAKWRDIQMDIETIFSDSEWTAHNINTYPTNWQGPVSGDEFVRVNVIAGASANLYGVDISTGATRVDVFTPAGEGSTRSNEICDLLDEVLQNKVLSNGTQTFASTVLPQGLDRENPGLYRVNYTVPYRYYS